MNDTFFVVLSARLLLTLSCSEVTLMLIEIKFCHRLVLLYAFAKWAYQVFDFLVRYFSFC